MEKEKSLGLIYFFRQSTKVFSHLFKKVDGATIAGNLDPFYIFGLLGIKNNIRDKKKLRKVAIFIVPIIIYAIIQLLFLRDLNILKFVINIFKIVLCIFVMLYFQTYNKKIDIYKFCKYFTILESFFLILSLLLQNNSILWRLNDYTNGYDLSRLQLFYLEPSELGFHVSIVIILLLSNIISGKKTSKNLKNNILLLLVNLIIMYFCKSTGAISILFIVAVLMLIYNLVHNFSKSKLKLYIIIAIALLCGLVLFMNSNSGVAHRIEDVLSGSDNSVNYRVDVSFNVFKHSLKDFNYLGCGFGNVNTPSFINRYRSLQLVQMIVNSFIYFWTETGIFGIIYWLCLMIYIIKKYRENKNITKFGLLSYIIIFQFLGSHFTNGLIWAIYGIVISKNEILKSTGD